jgi:hypothetical protein
LQGCFLVLSLYLRTRGHIRVSFLFAGSPSPFIGSQLLRRCLTVDADCFTPEFLVLYFSSHAGCTVTQVNERLQTLRDEEDQDESRECHMEIVGAGNDEMRE